MVIFMVIVFIFMVSYFNDLTNKIIELEKENQELKRKENNYVARSISRNGM